MIALRQPTKQFKPVKLNIFPGLFLFSNFIAIYVCRDPGAVRATTLLISLKVVLAGGLLHRRELGSRQALRSELPIVCENLVRYHRSRAL